MQLTHINRPRSSYKSEPAGTPTSSAKTQASLNDIHVKWEVKPLGRGYSFRNLFNGHYLAVERGASERAPIIASPYPVSWAVEPADAGYETWGYGYNACEPFIKC
jgi:hypothetical protein